MLFSPSFWRENMAMGIPYFHGENLAEFRVCYAMAYRQDFAFVSAVHIDMLILWRAEALQSIKHVVACRIHGEIIVTGWQSHRDDRAHNIAWICTYGNRLEHIPTLQGHELSWLERVTHIAPRFHHTKCTITHIQADIGIHASCTMQPHRVGK